MDTGFCKQRAWNLRTCRIVPSTGERLADLLHMRTRWARVTAFLIASSTGGLAACTTTMRVSRDELQADVMKRFPREYDRQVLKLRMSDPELEFFPGRPDILGVRVRLDVTSASGNSHIGGTANVEGALEYVKAEHAFYLRAANVKDIALDRPEGHGRGAQVLWQYSDVALEHAARHAVESGLESHPIYRLDAKRSQREAKAIKHLRDAHIDGRDLVLTVGL
jgi:hypothetical protein